MESTINVVAAFRDDAVRSELVPVVNELRERSPYRSLVHLVKSFQQRIGFGAQCAQRLLVSTFL